MSTKTSVKGSDQERYHAVQELVRHESTTTGRSFEDCVRGRIDGINVGGGGRVSGRIGSRERSRVEKGCCTALGPLVKQPEQRRNGPHGRSRVELSGEQYQWVLFFGRASWKGAHQRDERRTRRSNPLVQGR